MPNRARTTRTLVTLSLCAGLGALALSPSAATAEGALTGNYKVAHSTDVATGLWIRISAQFGEQTQTEDIRCRLAKGESSPKVWCPALDLALDVNLVEPGEHESVIEVDYLPVAIWIENHGGDLIGSDPVPPVINKAEAYWDWWEGLWKCAVEQADVDKCTANCGAAGVDSVSAEPTIPSNNPFMEPSCDVSCKCNGSDDVDVWTDPPEVLPAY